MGKDWPSQLNLAPYGEDKIYPDCDVSRSLVNLMNTKTIPIDKVYWIRQLGIELEQRPVELKDLL